MLPVEERRAWIKSRRQKRKQAQQARLRRQLFRMSLLLTILFICFLGFSYFPWAINDLENQIIVHGNVFTATAQIRTALGGSMYTPIYGLDPDSLEKKVESLETIKTAFVRRYAFPRPRIVVEVLEEHPWASLLFAPRGPETAEQSLQSESSQDDQSKNGIDAVISETGRIIPIKKFPRVIQPALKVYAARNLKMTPNDVKQWATWVSYIERQCGEPVTYVDMRRPFDVRVQTETLALKIGIPDATLTQRLGRLTSILPTLREYHDTLEYVDLGLDTNIPIKISKEPKKAAKKSADVQTARAESAGGTL